MICPCYCQTDRAIEAPWPAKQQPVSYIYTTVVSRRILQVRAGIAGGWMDINTMQQQLCHSHSHVTQVKYEEAAMRMRKKQKKKNLKDRKK